MKVLVTAVIGGALAVSAGVLSVSESNRLSVLHAQGRQAAPSSPQGTFPDESEDTLKFAYPTGRSTKIPPLPGGPIVLETTDYTIRVVPLASGLYRPWSMAFLPGGNILVTELSGRLRLVRPNGLDPQPVAGVPAVLPAAFQGLYDIVLHPRFAENQWVYLSYVKPLPKDLQALAIARGRWDGTALRDVTDIFIAKPAVPVTRFVTSGARLAFDRAGLLYMVSGGQGDESQDPKVHYGKTLRLRDNGRVPPDNPFVGRETHLPEIYTLGHRGTLGLAVHPVTGEMYENENGPQGGDEINVLRPGRNYGWPVASEGRDYGGAAFPAHHAVPGMEPPFMIWNPAIGISGMTFYTGDAFPRWKGNVFVGSLAYAHVERLSFNQKGEPFRPSAGRGAGGAREWLMIELKQRIRDIRQGPDGLLYVVTDSSSGHLLRIEPATAGK